MAEYINREKLLDELGESASHHAESGREYQLLLRDRNIVREQPTADVIERSEYEKLLKENEELKETCQNCIKEIEQAIKECKLQWAVTSMEHALGILKRNIGE